MNINGIRSRLNRAVAKMPPTPVTRESINVKLRTLGLDVEATWHFFCAENVGSEQARHMVLQGTLRPAIDRYRGMTGSYRQKAKL